MLARTDKGALTHKIRPSTFQLLQLKKQLCWPRSKREVGRVLVKTIKPSCEEELGIQVSRLPDSSVIH